MISALNPQRVTIYQPPADTGLQVVHADEALLVLDKPAGLLSVPGRGADKADSLATRAQARYPDALIVHRLDMGTSGLLLLARGAPMQATLSRMFRLRQIQKRYVAMVAGKLAADAGEIALPLIADWPNRPLQKVDHHVGKPSLTRYRVLAYDAVRDASRVELEPITGRSHQLRVHLMAIGHPILGDELYAPLTVRQSASRLLLHADELAFVHPVSGLSLRCSSVPGF